MTDVSGCSGKRAFLTPTISADLFRAAVLIFVALAGDSSHQQQLRQAMGALDLCSVQLINSIEDHE